MLSPAASSARGGLSSAPTTVAPERNAVRRSKGALPAGATSPTGLPALFERFVEQEQIREKRAQVNRRVQVIDELRANRGLGERQPHRRLRGTRIRLDDPQERG